MLDVSQQPVFTCLGKRDRHAFATGTACSSNAVHVRIRRRRYVEVDDMGHMFNVETPGRDVRRNEDLRRVVSKAPHHAIPLFLRQAAVQGLGTIPPAAKRFRQLVDFGTSSTEYDCRRGCLHIEHACQRGNLMPALDDERNFAESG